MEDQVGEFIRHNIVWAKLPPSVQQIIGTSDEYEKKIVEYSVKNQLRYRGNIVRHIKKNEKGYYEQLLKFSREHLMLFPYHLSDFIVTAMRITPFQYYITIMNDLIDQEKSYDTLPNFTAADCLRLLGIGRNQYIEIMNQCRSTKKFLSMIRKPPRDMLPTKPVNNIALEPFWHVYPGYITEDDVKLMVNSSEKAMIDKTLDETNVSAQRAGNFHEQDVRSLYLKGLVYLEVPIEDDDLIIVPPLEGFVMNRVTGDYFETLLYKTFISIDENTPVSELASILQTDISLVKNAISMYCRLGFAYKKNQDLYLDDYHPSWRVGRSSRAESESVNGRTLTVPATGSLNRKRSLANFFDALTNDSAQDGDSGSVVEENSVDSSIENLTEQTKIEEVTQNMNKLFNVSQSTPTHSKRIALLYDSTLAAFLMMGNLSTGLKSHAVTMFEVGKLPDESLDSLLNELSKISNITTDEEGSEAERYFLNAVMLFKTIKFLRYNDELLVTDKDASPETSTRSALGVDLIRCESLMNLDSQTCQRLLQKNYKLMISIAPFSKETKLLRNLTLPHLGPPTAAVISPWFKLFIYQRTGFGPPTLLIAKGSRITELPPVFADYEHLLVTPWGRDAATIAASSALFSINDALTHSSLLIQGFPSNSILDDKFIVHIPFPIEEGNDTTSGDEPLVKNPFVAHPAVVALSNALQLNSVCGYISLINISGNESADIEEHWTLFDCNFGIPLFDRSLNREVCDMIIRNHLCSPKNAQSLKETGEALTLQIDSFVQQTDRLATDGSVSGFSTGGDSLEPLDSKHHYTFPATSTSIRLPTINLLFHEGILRPWQL